ncbi:MAG: 50S ribosomal protein L15 [Legionellales bacterium]|nr:50S ribosomal protein L15 [Legionellales bacterium]
MKLNTLTPAEGAKRNAKRVGRGIGSGLGKTCGRGHKGQKARSGGRVRIGFEGGQMPLQMRLPKSGFTSRKQLCREQIRLHELNTIAGDTVSLETLKAAGLIRKNTLHVKIFASGTLDKSVTVVGIPVTKGAQQAIEAAGGKVE